MHMERAMELLGTCGKLIPFDQTTKVNSNVLDHVRTCAHCRYCMDRLDALK